MDSCRADDGVLVVVFLFRLLVQLGGQLAIGLFQLLQQLEVGSALLLTTSLLPLLLLLTDIVARCAEIIIILILILILIFVVLALAVDLAQVVLLALLVILVIVVNVDLVAVLVAVLVLVVHVLQQLIEASSVVEWTTCSGGDADESDQQEETHFQVVADSKLNK